MEFIEVLQAVISTLDRLGIPSMLVGSFASTYYGSVRYTQDADLVVNLNRNQVDDFVRAFSQDFYVSQELIEQALVTESSFNVIHFTTTLKVDFFILRGNTFSKEEFSRRTPQRIDPRADVLVCIQTPEDSLLSKLLWFRKGGEVSENQWRDVIGILKNQAGRLDTEYLQRWAVELGISDLLEKVRREVNV